MRIFSYRNRRRIRLTVLLLIVLAILAVVLLLLRFAFLDRYLVYTQKGAHFDMDAFPPSDSSSDESTTQPADPLPVEIIYVTPEEEAEAAAALSQVEGVYITCDMLEDVDAVRAALEPILAEPGQHAVMLALKNGAGRSYYTSSLCPTANVDITAIEALIRDLRDNAQVYLMASMPAFCDSAYAVDNQTEGLPISGGALWMDYDANYWLDPASEAVQAHLVALAQELAALGVQEVVFTEFYFPSSENIVYTSETSTTELVNTAAANVASALAGFDIAVSFQTADAAFVLPDAAARVALAGEQGSEAQAQATQYTADNARVLFLTDSRDTRFEAYSVLRPLLERGDEE